MFADRYEVRAGHAKGIGWSTPLSKQKYRWKRDALKAALQIQVESGHLTQVFVWDRLRLRVVY